MQHFIKKIIIQCSTHFPPPGVRFIHAVGSSYKLIIEPNLIISQGMEKAERDSILSNKYYCVNMY